LGTFQDLGLSKPLLKAIKEAGYEKPTSIQQEAVPQLLYGDSDFIGLAQTGTGKTAAFGWPLLDRIDVSQPYTQALILAPTRELGQQICRQLEVYSKYMGKVELLAVYGGAPIAKQISALKRMKHIIVATPGRLIDLVKRKAIQLDNISHLILDEADEMLNMGFKDELDQILSFTPSEKLTWLFSATMSRDVKRIADNYMNEAIEITVNQKNVVNSDIEHRYAVIRRSDRFEALTRFIDLEPNMRGLVFCKTKIDTQEIADALGQKKYRAEALHGDMSQSQRDRVMKKFRTGELPLLIATDVAARGIDVDDVSHVFHFSLPHDPAYYTHRSGRTARAGKKGLSIAFVGDREKQRIIRLAKNLGISIDRINIPGLDQIRTARLEQWCQRVLNQRVKGKMGDEVYLAVERILGVLSKEELLAKVAMIEIENWQSSEKDLNTEHKETRSNRSRGKRHHWKNEINRPNFRKKGKKKKKRNR
jgi:ATP-dependent RNA helicase DeaD